MSTNKEGPRAAIGSHQPAHIGELPEVDLAMTEGWGDIPGLSSTISDILDDLGYHLCVSCTAMPARSTGRCVVGRAVTLRYLPERRVRESASDGLIHQSALQHVSPGDVLVIEGDGAGQYSVFGGMAAHRAVQRGIAGVVVDGAVRDVDQITDEQLPVWSTGVTCVTGRGRLQGVGINVPIRIQRVQVCPGDIVIADDSGICFVPPEVLPEVGRRLNEILAEERRILGTR
ncbi:RraA family protein [Alicyclobacillus cycloheptanicus]|uniref:Putative 4-hydroxy-4-methyl-2-oxoglutarate aldolase n=1 Tax=Alicyclobacillus cycloheptanicus TaxID=1457 RepID=A0ABT9XG55_9BACL|nr:RraA family protein [Alicyclobacillus cycloheptanicus]MDQ0189064.1 regulator of RNase E activity RraA [Alicyclobacillus cycloheptanicus]WDM00200.1 RraA family protein [Alicyclobacillus cycloheptanicus]